MTAQDRAAIDHEITKRHSYANGILADPLNAMQRIPKVGWRVRDWRGESVPIVFKRKRDAVEYADKAAGECLRKVGELRAQLELAEWDAEMAGVTVDERRAAVRAEEAAIDRPRWRRSA